MSNQKKNTGDFRITPSIPCVIENITGVWKFRNWSEGRIYAQSLPGHLFHYMISGKYHLKTNGREYDIRPGNVIYYHEVEDVEVDCGDKPIEFYSVGFTAPDWTPLPLSMRVFQGGKIFEKVFAKIYDSFNNIGSAISQIGLFKNLYRLIELVEVRREKIGQPGRIRHSLWWEVENSLLRSRNFHASVDDMTEIAMVSRATLTRICRTATGLSPLQRVIRLRMNYAGGLLLHSSLSINEIAEYLGYSRVNEFSREYHENMGISPSRARILKNAAD